MSIEQLAFVVLVVTAILGGWQVYIARRGARTVEEIAALLRRLGG